MKFKSIMIKDLPPDIKLEVGLMVIPYSVCIVAFTGTHENTDIELIGSGTYVTTNGRHGILTVSHVLNSRLFRKHEFMGVNIGRGLQLHKIPMDALKLIHVSPASGTREGPDLGFIELFSTDIKLLESTMSFWSLDNNKSSVLSNDDNLVNGPWCAVGVPDEDTSEIMSDADGRRFRAFKTTVGFTGVNGYCERPPHDYYEVPIRYGKDSDAPETFEGMSGGGLWEFEFNFSHDKIQVVTNSIMLKGVIFFQSERISDGRIIYAHGKKSIYNFLPDTLAKMDN